MNTTPVATEAQTTPEVVQVPTPVLSERAEASPDTAIEAIRGDTANTSTALVKTAEGLPLNEDEESAMIKRIIEKLRKCKNANDRVDTVAWYMDVLPVDSTLGFLFPGISDTIISTISAFYLMIEAHQADLKWTDRFKILAYEAADALIGTIPLVGDVADYLYKSKKKSAKIFKARLGEMAKEAMTSGVSQTEIDEILPKQI